MIRILLIAPADDAALRLAADLRKSDYLVQTAENAEQALELLDQTNIQMIIAHSGCGGIDLTAELRAAGSSVPIIVLTDNTARAEMRRIFRSGADGYMVTPVDTEELTMRIRNLLWRCRVVDDASLQFGSCTLHCETLTLETPSGDIELRRLEFLLLEKLMSYPGKVFSRAQLMDDLWGYDSESDPRTVDTHIRRLRQKLRDVDDIRIQTVRGLGYRGVVPRKIRNAEKKN